MEYPQEVSFHFQLESISPIRLCLKGSTVIGGLRWACPSAGSSGKVLRLVPWASQARSLTKHAEKDSFGALTCHLNIALITA